MTTTRPAPGLGQQLWISTVVFGLLAVILGVVILVWPGKSLLVAAVLFGVYLVVSGLVMVFLAFSLPIAGGGSRFLHFLAGAASIVLGVLAFRHFGEGYAILLLAIWVAVGFIFRGMSSVAAAISHQGFPGRGWAIFFGVISLIAGLVVLAYPFHSIVTLMLISGIWLVILGAAEIVAGITMRRDLSKLEKARTAAVPPSAPIPPGAAAPPA